MFFPRLDHRVLRQVARSSLVLGIASLPLAAQDDSDTDLDRVLAAQARRIATMQKVAPAVCSVMSMDAPGGGSGVVIDPLGFVLTNFHVVGKPDVTVMKVGMPDGRLYRAEVLGIDPGSDLAVLLLEPQAGEPREFPSAPLGDSQELLVGETVFAMGNPFLLATDFAPTTTFGIVSGTRRYQPGGGNRMLVYPDCIQVDAPVNPGNSGGPLFDMQGRVVGINGRISIQDQRGRVNVGVGFAIASHQIRNFLADLMAGRHAEHGTLDLNAWFMSGEAMGGSREPGVFVQSIFEDSKVIDHGIGLGDELLTFNGTRIRSANQLATLIGVLPAGAWVELTFRHRDDDGSFGPVQRAEFPVRRLDTGSSNDERLASAPHRELALQALARPVGGGEEPAEGVTLTIRGPADDGGEELVMLRRSGAMLRIDYQGGSNDGLALIHRGDGDAFAIAKDGTVTDATAEQAAKLSRILQTNPWLGRGPQQRELLQLDAEGTELRDGVMASGELVGGVMVGNAPGFRVRLPGDGQREVFFGLEGQPLGCVYRDPLQRALIELRGTGEGSRILVDGVLAAGWRIDAPVFEAVPATLFERPTR